MPRYIDADKLIKEIRQHQNLIKAIDPQYEVFYSLAHDHIIGIVEIQPTADIQEVKRSKNEKS